MILDLALILGAVTIGTAAGTALLALIAALANALLNDPVS